MLCEDLFNLVSCHVVVGIQNFRQCSMASQNFDNVRLKIGGLASGRVLNNFFTESFIIISPWNQIKKYPVCRHLFGLFKIMITDEKEK